MLQVLLIGRPNTGKSSLFNRIIGKREAVVYHEPGTTRDYKTAESSWRGKKFNLVDSGGIVSKPIGFEKDIITQAKLAMKSADVLVIVLDAKSGVTALDREVMKLARTSGKPYLVTVNKVDSREIASELDDFYALGIKELFTISALHGKGIGDFLDGLVKLFPKIKRAPAKKSTRKTFYVSILGRPNVGKSSLINAFLGKNRAIVSEIPGTTIDVISGEVNLGDFDIVVFDTAGLKKSGKLKSDIEYYGNLRSNESIKNADLCLLVIDGEEGPTSFDKHLASRVVKENAGLIIVVNKWDMVTKTEEEYARIVKRYFVFAPYAICIFISAKTGFHIDDLRLHIKNVLSSLLKRYSPRDVGNVIKDAISKNPPPTAGGKRFIYKYSAQLKSRPPIFVAYGKNAMVLKAPYMRYLEHRIAEAFNYVGVQVKLELKEKI